MALLWVSQHWETASSSEMVCLIGRVFKQIPEQRPLPTLWCEPHAEANEADSSILPFGPSSLL